MSQRRVVEEHPHSLEAQLLRAGRAVKAPDATFSVTLSALGLGATATAAASVSGTAHANAWGWFGSVSAKWTAIAIVAASGTWVVARFSGWLSTPSPANFQGAAAQSAAHATLAHVPGQPQRASVAVTTMEGLATPTAVATPAPQKASVRPNAKTASPLAQTESPPSAAKPGESLGAEVALIDAARRAVDERQSNRALALLQQHDRQFTRPRLAQEASLLRARAFEQLAQRDVDKAPTAVSPGSSPLKQPVGPQE
jgi:hypothetical protein